MMLCLTSKDANDAWERLYEHLLSQDAKAESRDGSIHGEVLNCIVEILDPTRNIVTSPIRKLSYRYMIGEFLWYLSCNRNLSEIQKITSNWDRFSDDGEVLNSNYGWCIHKKYYFDQWEFIKEELSSNPDSRRAVIHIKEPRDLEHKPSKDVNCTVCVQFLVRDGKLYATTYMRSNDIWLGFPYDVFYFTNLQVLLSMELGLELGTYTHIVGSMHLYERNVKSPYETATFEDEALFLSTVESSGESKLNHDDLDYVEFD